VHPALSVCTHQAGVERDYKNSAMTVNAAARASRSAPTKWPI